MRLDIGCNHDHLFALQCPVASQACPSWSARPSGLVRPLAGLITEGMCLITMSPSSFQSLIAKNQISVHSHQPIGLLAFIAAMADWSSSHLGSGSLMADPNSDGTNCTHLMSFAAVTAAISSASVESSVVTDCALDCCMTAPLQCVREHTVVDLLLAGLFLCATSTEHIRFAGNE